MTDQEIADIIDSLAFHANMNTPCPLTCRDAIQTIRELQSRLAAEQQAHEATIKHCDEMLNQVGMS